MSASEQPPGRSKVGTRLFAPGAFHVVCLEVSASGVESLRENPRADVPARLSLDQERYPGVELHLKGSQGSFRPVDDKPAMTLSFPRDQPCDGLSKLHLNNSVEDPSYLHELLAGELFRAAGVAAPRVAHARVELNGRPLGLYVLKEGFTQEFVRGYLPQPDGALYEPEPGQDVDGRMKCRLGGNAPPNAAGFERLVAALAETDAACRWRRLEAALDMDRFLSFMALEVMLSHRDGYCLARNNFRVYRDLRADQAVFLPHGMDQLLGLPDLSWRPHMAGLVARAILDTPEGRRRYRERFEALLNRVFVLDAMERRVDECLAGLRSFLRPPELKQVTPEVAMLKQRILRRAASLRRQLAEPEPSVLELTAEGGRLEGWLPVDAFSARRIERIRDAAGTDALRIVAGQTTTASWRTRAMLPPGRYRFEGRLKVRGVEPLPFGKTQGAGLRVSGGARSDHRLTGDSSWRELGAPFEVQATVTPVEFVCELRARAGEAWFDAASLRARRNP